MLRKLKYLRELQNNQWKKKEELQEIQNKKLRHIIDYAYRYVRFYRELFNSVGVKPCDIKSVDDLSKLPIIDKKMISNAGTNAYSSLINTNRCINIHTGGTTGYPLNIPRDSVDCDFAWAMDHRTMFNIGYRPTQKQLSTLSHLTDLKQRPSFIQNIGFFRRKNISVFLTPEDKIKIINIYKPDHLWLCRTTELCEVATCILNNTEKLSFKPKIISVSTEIITREYREHIENAFGEYPLDLYGSAETALLSWECTESHKYHMNSDCAVMSSLR